MSAAQDWIVYAARTAYTAEVQAIIERRGEYVAAFVDNLDDGPQPLRSSATIPPSELLVDHRSAPVVVPLITPGFRFLAVQDARKRGLDRFVPLVDPTAVVATTASIRNGAVVNAAAVIGANSLLDEFVSVNRSASIGHDCTIAAYASIGPGATLAGSVAVECGAFIGAGAVCLPGITIGANVVVGGGAVVTGDVPDGATVVGNPARVVATSATGYQGGFVPHE